jgi:adenylate kinase
MNSPKTIIFVGRSGAGKGTQVELLKKFLAESDTSREVRSLIMGDIYRAFFKADGYIQDIARDISMRQGRFQPDFMTNALFINDALKLVDGTSHLFLDGYPRSVSQLGVTKELLEYVKREGATLVNVEVSREEVTSRMMKRGRGDDSESAIESRMAEYDRTVVSMLEAAKSDPFFTYVEVNGEQSVEAVHAEMKAALGL